MFTFTALSFCLTHDLSFWSPEDLQSNASEIKQSCPRGTELAFTVASSCFFHNGGNKEGYMNLLNVMQHKSPYLYETCAYP